MSAQQGEALEEIIRRIVREEIAATGMTEKPEQWLKAQEAADHLGLSVKGLYGRVSRGELPAHRVGARALRFKLSELDARVPKRENGN